MSEIKGREFNWDSEIENDSPDYTLLPDGDYNFEVLSFERQRHEGSAKLPPCNKASLRIKIESAEGIAIINHNLFLHECVEGLLCAFFTSIGQRQKGEKISMNWNKVTGAKGRCKVGIKKWTNDKGEEKVFNEIKKFYEPAENSPAAGISWKAGTF